MERPKRAYYLTVGNWFTSGTSSFQLDGSTITTVMHLSVSDARPFESARRGDESTETATKQTILKERFRNVTRWVYENRRGTSTKVGALECMLWGRWKDFQEWHLIFPIEDKLRFDNRQLRARLVLHLNIHSRQNLRAVDKCLFTFCHIPINASRLLVSTRSQHLMHLMLGSPLAFLFIELIAEL